MSLTALEARAAAERARTWPTDYHWAYLYIRGRAYGYDEAFTRFEGKPEHARKYG